MYKLARVVRFSINPFLAEEQVSVGFNSYASKPAGEGLAIFLELLVELVGPVDAATGFVVNVGDIDKQVRQYVIPIFATRVAADFQRRRHIGFDGVGSLLKASWAALAGRFGRARIGKLELALNPFRKVTVKDESCKMIYFSEKFEFAAMHKLWNDEFSHQKNLEIFGKCANPTGHGHNYVIDVTVALPDNKVDFAVGRFEQAVNEHFIRLVDHKNLNVDVPELADVNPTVENIAAFAWTKLVDRLDPAQLHCVTVWENDRTFCSYDGRP